MRMMLREFFFLEYGKLLECYVLSYFLKFNKMGELCKVYFEMIYLVELFGGLC